MRHKGDNYSYISTKQSIQISSGKLDNAVQATQFINSIIPNPVTPQTVRNTLRSQDFTLQQRRKSLCSSSLIVRALWEWQGLIFDHRSGEKELSTLQCLDLAPTMDAGRFST